MINCLLLSAGLNERFGSPKALAQLSSHTVIEHIINTLMATSCSRIIVVLGAYAKNIEPLILKHKRVRIVYNKDYYLGQTSSIQAGWNHIDSDANGVLLLPVDCPMVQPSSINILIREFQNSLEQVTIPTFQGKKGHPPAIPIRLGPEILELPHDQGVNSILKRYPLQTLEINDPGIIQSFNTPEEFEELKKTKKPC
ncbi:MAG: nucleotidyltransferase family protein [Candidatus Omnitrophica bacterium]|nr:nucleotidyltransferase family protein [Candidatus Omnitrophota bacterium]